MTPQSDRDATRWLGESGVRRLHAYDNGMWLTRCADGMTLWRQTDEMRYHGVPPVAVSVFPRHTSPSEFFEWLHRTDTHRYASQESFERVFRKNPVEDAARSKERMARELRDWHTEHGYAFRRLAAGIDVPGFKATMDRELAEQYARMGYNPEEIPWLQPQ